jgi:hypothetical protein
MRRAKYIAIVTTILFALTTAGVVAFASDSESISKLQIGVWAANVDGWSCRDNAVGKYLSKGDQATYRTTLHRGNTYMLFGAGCDSVRDLDIKVYDENWNLVAKDSLTDAIPAVAFTPTWTGTYHVRLIMYDGYGHSNYAVCYR